MKKFGIVIPTHCRAHWLHEALNILMPIVRRYSDDVCVYVTDNASDDGTSEVIAPILNDYRGLIDYYYHKEAIPYYENFNFGVSQIDAEYVFLHGDDDLVTPYFIKYILDLINKEQTLALIHFNYYICNAKRGYVGNIRKDIDFSAPIKKYSSGKDLLKVYYNSVSFMGANVFKKKLWVDNINSQVACKYYGYEWLYVLLKGTLDKPAAYVETPLFVQRFSKTNMYSYKMPLYFHVGLSKLFKDLDLELFGGWKIFAKKNRKWEYYMLICKVFLDRTMYKEYYREMKTYIVGSDKLLLYLCTFIFPAFFTKYTVYTYFRIRHRLGILKNHLYDFT